MPKAKLVVIDDREIMSKIAEETRYVLQVSSLPLGIASTYGSIYPGVDVVETLRRHTGFSIFVSDQPDKMDFWDWLFRSKKSFPVLLKLELSRETTPSLEVKYTITIYHYVYRGFYPYFALQLATVLKGTGANVIIYTIADQTPRATHDIYWA